MIRKIAFIALLITLSSTVFAQSTDNYPRRGTPNIPGAFVLELGLNRGLSAPAAFDLGLWGSRTLNIYYQYDIRLLKSRFSFVPGIGLSLERFKFRNLRTLGFDGDSVELFTPAQAGLTGVKKSQLITNYVDIPLELRYSSNPDDPGRSFKVSVGARIGYMYDAFNKVKYREDGELKKFKNKQSFNLNEIRYGVFGKIGVGNFSLFGYYNLTPLFKEGEGLWENRVNKDFNTVTVGISLASF